MLGGVFTLVGWLLISFAQFISGSKSGFLAMFLIGRLLTSFGGGWAVFCVSVSHMLISYVCPEHAVGIIVSSCGTLV